MVLVSGGPKIAFMEISLRQKTLNKDPRYLAPFCAPYGTWIGLQANRFSRMPQKCHLPKISS